MWQMDLLKDDRRLASLLFETPSDAKFWYDCASVKDLRGADSIRVFSLGVYKRCLGD